jgi:hypothetical protein
MRLQFTVRDLLWLTLVVGMGIGWWLDQRHLISKAAEDRRLQLQAAEQDRMELVIRAEDYAREIEVLRQQLRKVEPAVHDDKRYQAEMNDLTERIKERINMDGRIFRLAPTIVTEVPDSPATGK